jgi:hypothetical protein
MASPGQGIFQVFEELGDDLIRQLIYELFGAFLESTHDSIISVGAGAGQPPGPLRHPFPLPHPGLSLAVSPTLDEGCLRRVKDLTSPSYAK